jgi:hypothetical protein
MLKTRLIKLLRGAKVGKVSKNQSGFSAVIGLLVLVVVIMIGVVGFLVYDKNNDTNTESKSKPTVSTNKKSEPKSVSTETFDQERVKRIQGFNTASSTFKAALVGKFYDEVTAALPCLDTESNTYISVSKTVRDDFALGQYCTSGGTSIFANTEAGWARVGSLAMGAPACSVVDQYKVSKEIDSKCLLDDGSSREVAYP